jgi:hypothetical protein
MIVCRLNDIGATVLRHDVTVKVKKDVIHPATLDLCTLLQ